MPSLSKKDELNLNKIVNETSASSDVSEIDKSILVLNKTGHYKFFSDNISVDTEELNVVVYDDGTTTLSVFEDTNGNRLKDPDENYIEDLSTLKVSLESDVEMYDLNSGWSLIHIDMINKNTDEPLDNAENLLDYWRKQGADVVHIASYEDGGFKMYSKREFEIEYSENFNIIPGQGIFVMNLGVRKEVTVHGKKIEDGLQVKLNNGWNLIGISQAFPGESSEDLINVLAESGLEANMISQFENGVYTSVIKNEDDGTLYGNNFNIIEQRGYFIKIQSGGEKRVKL